MINTPARATGQLRPTLSDRLIDADWATILRRAVVAAGLLALAMWP